MIAKDLNFILPVNEAKQARQFLSRMSKVLRHASGAPAMRLIGVAQVESNQMLSMGARAAQQLRIALDDVGQIYPCVTPNPGVIVSSDVWQDMKHVIAGQQDEGDVLLIPWKNGQSLMNIDLAQVMADPPCDVAVVQLPRTRRKIQRILLPVRGGSFAELGAQIALRIARNTGAKITLMHVASDESAGEQAALHELFDQLTSLYPEYMERIFVAGPADRAILREVASHQVVILGASNQADAPFSRLALRALANEDLMTFVIRTKAPFRMQPRVTKTNATPVATSILVDKWFAENTFHCREFANIGRLIDLKRQQGLKISLGLPALNEEETIGSVIDAVKGPLMDDAPLLDEIVLIDSDSTDGTRQIAASRGVPSVIHQQVLPECGARRGKGEGLWKSLHVMKGDIIAWIDTDINNPDPRFVFGILGPLLIAPHIQYAKGFYQRPIRVDGRLLASGGGRVTELLARPMFNLFFPRLSGLVQPLSGEYAGRRSALERLPFYSGYGVETGLLLDMLESFGLDAIAQVDLEERVHRNQDMQALSRMSFALLQVFMEHLRERNQLTTDLVMERTMKLLRVEGDHFYLEETDINEMKRPPMIEIPEYLEKWRAVAPVPA
jgi:glucosyl-3-phosphoglycerate synthase